jgi:hypothetical protein
MSKPYKEQIKDNIKYREFDPMVETDELVWHRDRENRTITVLEGKGWFFQMDNEIPKEMCAGDILEVKKMVYHRLYKSGSTPLKISIEEKYMKSFKQFNESKIDEKVNKSSPIYKEYLQLKKLSLKSLRDQLSRNYKVVDLKGYDKEGAISQILRDKHGNKKVDKVFNESKIDEKIDIKKALKKVKGLSNKQVQLLLALPAGTLTSVVNQLSTLVSANDPLEENILNNIISKAKEDSLEEASYPINIRQWQFSHGAKKPKEKGNWIFDYEASIGARDGSIGLQKDTFIAKAGSTFKNAAKQLFKFLQKELKVKPKDVKITLAP